MVSDFSMCDEVVWYCKTQYRKLHWLEMLYRKDDPFGRALLFSAMRRKILRLRYHAVYPVVKMIALHCAYVRVLESMGGILRASVTMKNKTRRVAGVPHTPF